MFILRDITVVALAFPLSIQACLTLTFSLHLNIGSILLGGNLLLLLFSVLLYHLHLDLPAIEYTRPSKR